MIKMYLKKIDLYLSKNMPTTNENKTIKQTKTKTKMTKSSSDKNEKKVSSPKVEKSKKSSSEKKEKKSSGKKKKEEVEENTPVEEVEETTEENQEEVQTEENNQDDSTKVEKEENSENKKKVKTVIEAGPDTLPQLIEALKVMKSNIDGSIRLLQATQKYVKQLEKKAGKKKKNSGEKKPPSDTGINKKFPATEISVGLKEFMELDEGELVSRVDAMKFICSYIKGNNLQLEDQKKFIKPDEKLNTLFPTLENENFTFTQIMGLLSKNSCFPKKEESN